MGSAAVRPAAAELTAAIIWLLFKERAGITGGLSVCLVSFALKFLLELLGLPPFALAKGTPLRIAVFVIDLIRRGAAALLY